MKNTFLNIILILAFSNVCFSQSTPSGRVKIKLFSGSITWDNMYISQNASAADHYEQKDALKLFNPDADLYSLSSDNVALSIDSRSYCGASIVPLAIKVTSTGNYSIRIESYTMSDSLVGWFKDELTGQLLQINAGVVHNFIMSEANIHVKDRFKILFTKSTVLGLNFTTFTAKQTPGKVQLSWNVNDESSIVNYIIERAANSDYFIPINVIPSKNSGITTYSFEDNNMITGKLLYRIKSVDKTGTIKFSPVRQVYNYQAGIKTYPNPVLEGKLSVEVNNVASGTYKVEILSLTGSIIYAGQLTCQSQSGSHTINLDASLAGGLYILKLSGQDVIKTCSVLVR